METLIIKMPEGVEPPRFELFEEVIYQNQKGVVVGIAYISAIEALYLQLGKRWGWQYDLSFMFGATPEQALLAAEPVCGIWECQLQPVNLLEAVS